MLNIEHLAARVGQLYAMVVPLARPIQYRGGGGGVVAAPVMPPDAALRRSRRPPQPNRRAGSRTDKATDRSLVEVVGVCTRR
jgi:hypothetical protein